MKPLSKTTLMVDSTNGEITPKKKKKDTNS